MDKFLKDAKYLWSKTNRFHRVIFLFAIIELRVIPGGKLGFRCNDPTLSHQFNGDTISWKWLMAVCILLPLVVLLIVERLQPDTDKATAKKQSLRWYREYLFGYCVNLTLVQFLKFLVGSPRPHFFDTCKPKEAKTCMAMEYVTSYTCTESYWNWQSDQSFPSGHTSLAVHAGFFIAYYLYRRTQPGNKLVKLVQAVVLVTSVWCGLSRVIDRRHHWTDVGAGTVIGIATLLYTTHHLCQNFVCTRKTEVAVEKENKQKENEEKGEVL